MLLLIAKLSEKPKMPKFENKNDVFGLFQSRILKNYCHSSIQHPEICLIAKILEKTKMLRFQTKTAAFEFFWTRVFKKLS